MWNHAFRLTVHQSWHNFGGAAICVGFSIMPWSNSLPPFGYCRMCDFFLFHSSFWLLPSTILYWVCNPTSFRLTTSLYSYFLVYWLPLSVSVSVDVWTLIFTRLDVVFKSSCFSDTLDFVWMLINIGVWGCWWLCIQLLSTSAPEHSGKLSGILDVASNRRLRLSNHLLCVSWMFFQLCAENHHAVSDLRAHHKRPKDGD